MVEAIIKVGTKPKPPEPGKKRWKIITPENVVFQVNSDLASLFTEGKSYKVFFENHEFQGFKFKVITAAPEEVPDISTGKPEATYTRPRTAKEDEEGINRRHRLNWIGERLDSLAGNQPCTFDDLRPIAGVLALLYDTISEAQEATADPRQKDYPEGYKTPKPPGRATTYKPGQPASTEQDFDDDIPY